MSGKTIIITAIGIVVVGGGVWWATSGSDQNITGETGSEVETQTNNNQETASVSENTEGTASIQELIKRGEAVECTFAFENEDGTSGEGHGYFAGDERMHMESNINQNGGTYNANYVITDGTMYMWGEMQQGTFGLKMPFEAIEEEGSEYTQNQSQMPVEMDQNVSFECSGWSVDESRFSVPGDVEFMDMGAMMQGMQGMTPEQMEAMQEQYGDTMPQ